MTNYPIQLFNQKQNRSSNFIQLRFIVYYKVFSLNLKISFFLLLKILTSVLELRFKLRILSARSVSCHFNTLKEFKRQKIPNQVRLDSSNADEMTCSDPSGYFQQKSMY